MDKLTVLGQGTNERMLLDKRQLFLPGRGAVKQGAQRTQAVSAMRPSNVAGPFDGVAAVTMGQVQQSLQNTHALDAACPDHGLRPTQTERTEPTHLVQQPGGTT